MRTDEPVTLTGAELLLAVSGGYYLVVVSDAENRCEAKGLRYDSPTPSGGRFDLLSNRFDSHSYSLSKARTPLIYLR